MQRKLRSFSCILYKENKFMPGRTVVDGLAFDTERSAGPTAFVPFSAMETLSRRYIKDSQPSKSQRCPVPDIEPLSQLRCFYTYSLNI